MARRAPGEYISLPSNAAAHVDAYFEYRAWDKWTIRENFNNNILLSSIVGDDDGGNLFTPEEYENYKKQVLPMVKKRIDWYWKILFRSVCTIGYLYRG